MIPTIWSLVAALAVLMLACAWCGYGRRYLGFLLTRAIGLALNGAWMVWGLGAKPLENPVIYAQIAAIGYAVCAFLIGWLVGRIVRRLQETSDTEEGQV